MLVSPLQLGRTWKIDFKHTISVMYVVVRCGLGQKKFCNWGEIYCVLRMSRFPFLFCFLKTTYTCYFLFSDNGYYPPMILQRALYVCLYFETVLKIFSSTFVLHIHIFTVIFLRDITCCRNEKKSFSLCFTCALITLA